MNASVRRSVNVLVVVGNLKRESRTRAAAELVARRLTGMDPAAVIEVADLGSGLFGWGDAEVARAKQQVIDADVVIVASPTFKGSYSGLLKLFLDQFGAGELIGVTAYAVMLGGSWKHALAPDVFLTPVLVEIGLSCPAPGLYLLDSDYEDSDVLTHWLVRADAALPAGLRR